MNKNIYIVLALLLFCSSCENELSFTPPNAEPKLIMNATLGEHAFSNDVYFSVSGIENVSQVRDAHLKLFVNGEKVEEQDAAEYYDYKRAVLQTYFNPGDKVRLEATANDGEYQVESEVTVPQAPLEFYVDTATVYIKDGGYLTKCLKYKIHIKDRKGEKNYYRLNISEGTYFNSSLPDNWEPYNDCIIINREDVVLTEGHITSDDNKDNNFIDMNIPNFTNIFTDRMFEDGEYVMTVYTNLRSYSFTYDKNGVIGAYQVNIESITPEAYRYYRALNCLNSDKYEPTIMEPVVLPQNVKNGLGFVNICSKTSYRIITYVYLPHK